MNKTKRIMTAVVSLVLASTMCFSIAACTNESGTSTSTSTSSGSTSTGSTDSSAADSSSSGSTTVDQITLKPSQTALTPNATINSDGTVTYNYAEGTTLEMNVGYQKDGKIGGISYGSSNISGSVTLPDGATYKTGDLKPAWKSLSSQLGITFNDGFTNLSASAQITTNVTQGILNNYNVITAQGSSIVNAGTADTSLFLDLSLYLDYMPNYKKFLQDNPIVYMSLTSDVESGAMYYAPYFDGNDDIEKYEIAKKNWASRVLDETYTSANTISFATSVSSKASSLTGSSTYGLTSTSASVESYMGTTGSWWIESTDPDNTSSTVTITVNYDDALAAAKNESSALGAAYKAATNSVYSGESGNIVDIQNAAINATDGAVTGAQLTEMLRAYIDVAYQGSDGKSYYSTRADVFNGYDACWDVDLLVALMRCIVTFGNTNLGTDSDNADIYGLTGRQGNSQRESDMYSLAGELYGVRGFTSRYNFTYIDSDGVLQDNRADAESYETLDKMHAMVQEGLLNVTTNQVANKTSYYTKAGAPEAYMIYDYVQTQTANGGYSVMGLGDKITSLEDDYDFEPIVTPVSKWNDGDTSEEANVDGISYDYDDETGTYKYMRFTESWRSVKNTGFCVPLASVSGNADKLAAVLAFIDYLFSNDGQILMTFGGMSTSNSAVDSTGTKTSKSDVTSSDDGWWYANEVTLESGKSMSDYADLVGGQYYIKDEYASQYFCYNNKLYEGTYYNGKQYPTMTNSSLAFYYGYSVNGTSQSTASGFQATGVRSYTDYARYIVGAALPIGNKLQAFEFQCTSEQGINGGNIVAAGLTNGTISHVYQTIGADNGKGYWYTIVATTLPYDSITSSWISENVAETLDGSVFANASGVPTNFYIDVIRYGLGNTGYQMTYISSTQTVPETGADCVTLLNNTYKLNTYEGYMQYAWEDALYFYQGYIVYIGK